MGRNGDKPPPPTAGKTELSAVVSDKREVRPSLTETREVDAFTAQELVTRTARTGSVPAIAAGAEIPSTEARTSEELSQTVEGPSGAQLVILNAAEELIAQKGFASITEEQIAKAANVSADVFCAYFADKLAVLRGLSDRFCAQAIGLTNDATHSGTWDHATPREVIEVATRSILDFILSRASLVRAVLSSGDEELLDAFRRVGTHVTVQVVRVIGALEDDDKPNERDVAFVFLLSVSLAHHAILIGTASSGVEFEPQELSERVIQAVRGYLDRRTRSP